MATLSSNRRGHLCGISVSDDLSARDQKDTHLLVKQTEEENYGPTQGSTRGQPLLPMDQLMSLKVSSWSIGSSTLLADMCLLQTMD